MSESYLGLLLLMFPSDWNGQALTEIIATEMGAGRVTRYHKDPALWMKDVNLDSYHVRTHLCPAVVSLETSLNVHHVRDTSPCIFIISDDPLARNRILILITFVSEGKPQLGELENSVQDRTANEFQGWVWNSDMHFILLSHTSSSMPLYNCSQSLVLYHCLDAS